MRMCSSTSRAPERFLHSGRFSHILLHFYGRVCYNSPEMQPACSQEHSLSGHGCCWGTLTSWSWFLSPMLMERLAREMAAVIAYKLITTSATLFSTSCSSTIVWERENHYQLVSLSNKHHQVCQFKISTKYHCPYFVFRSSFILHKPVLA